MIFLNPPIKPDGHGAGWNVHMPAVQKRTTANFSFSVQSVGEPLCPGEWREVQQVGEMFVLRLYEACDVPEMKEFILFSTRMLYLYNVTTF